MTAMGSQYGHDVPDTIENGYFVFTIMPTLHCPYNCKHCYLSLEQRRDTTTMTIEQMREVCRKVDAYWDQVQPPHRVVLVYNYGGEPTSTGPGYFESYVRMMAEEFPASKGYEVKHVMLTSLLGVDLDVWAPLWHRYTGGYIQTSYDGSMRSNSYVRKWEAKVRDAVARGLRVATISVVNSDLLAQGAAQTLDILTDLGICETGWLPFMLNEQNSVPGKYDRYAPTMAAFNDYMIAMLDHWYSLKYRGLMPPSIGEAHFAVDRSKRSPMSNMCGQTLFLLPNGDFVLPNYKDGYKEYMHLFGNILEANTSFHDILVSRERRLYMRRQVTRNNNPECQGCAYKNACLLEFAKPNKPNDECFGAKRFVEHAIHRNSLDPMLDGPVTLY
ncbi:transcriptional regulator [Pseudomonas aeruginosa]